MCLVLCCVGSTPREPFFPTSELGVNLTITETIELTNITMNGFIKIEGRFDVTAAQRLHVNDDNSITIDGEGYLWKGVQKDPIPVTVGVTEALIAKGFAESTTNTDYIVCFVDNKYWYTTNAGTTWNGPFLSMPNLDDILTAEYVPGGTSIMLVLDTGVLNIATANVQVLSITHAVEERGIIQSGKFYYHDATKLYSVLLSNPYTITEIVAETLTNLVRVNDNLWFAIDTTSGKITKSTDQGANWADTSIATPSITNLASDGTYLYYFNESNGLHLYRTTDGTSSAIVINFPDLTQYTSINAWGHFRVIAGDLKAGITIEKTNADASVDADLYLWRDIGDYIVRCTITNAVNPQQARMCTIHTLPQIADAFSPDLIYTISDATPTERFKGKYLGHQDGLVQLIGIDLELHYLSAGGAYAGKTGDEILDDTMDKLVLCTKGSIDDTGATVYTQTFGDATTIAQALNTYGRIGLGLIAVQSDSSVDFDTLADLPSSGRTLKGRNNAAPDTLRFLSALNQNGKKYDKVVVVGAGDDTEALQDTQGTGSNKIVITRLDLHCQNAVVDFAAGVWAVVRASEQISRIYQLEEWNATWMEVGSTCVCDGIPEIPYGTYIVLASEYNLAAKHAKWTLCQTINIQPLVADITNNLIVQGGSDSAGTGTAIAQLNTMQDLAAGNIKTPLRLNTNKITGLGDPAAAQDATTYAFVAKHCMIGSDNAAWIPCVFEIEEEIGKIYYDNTAGGGMTNVDGTDLSLLYRCPLPTNRGGLKLYVSGVRVELSDADNGDEITNIYVGCENYAGATQINNDATDYETPATVEQTFNAVDASGKASAFVVVDAVCTNAADFALRGVTLRCYYA